MIGLEITINNRKPVFITSDDVAYILINCNYSFGDNIYIGGAETLRSLIWVDENLKIGDKITIKVVEISKVPSVKKIICDKDQLKIKYEQLKNELQTNGLI